MCTDFVDSLVECFETNKYGKTGTSGAEGGNFIVGYREGLYQVYSDYQIEMSYDKYMSCGCGSGYALGSMRALESVANMKPKEKIKIALEASEHFCTDVSAPFIIEKL